MKQREQVIIRQARETVDTLDDNTIASMSVGGLTSTVTELRNTVRALLEVVDEADTTIATIERLLGLRE